MIKGHERVDVIEAGDGDDTISREGGNDTVCAGEGNDTSSAATATTVYGGGGIDNIDGDVGND